MRTRRRKTLKNKWIELRTSEKMLIIAGLLLLLYPLSYLIANILFVILFVFQDYIPISTKYSISYFNSKRTERERIIINSNNITKKWYVQRNRFPFSKTILESSKEMGYLAIINDSTENVAVVVMYKNPNIFGPRIIEFFEYGNQDSIGVYYYNCFFSEQPPYRSGEDTLYIHKKDKHLYKKSDTIYLKPYL